MSAGRARWPDRSGGRARTAPPDRERGSAAIELVGIVTMLLVVTWLCVQGLFAAQVGSTVQQAARDGARAGTIPGRSVVAAVQDQLPGWTRLESLRTGSDAIPGCTGSCVRVEVSVPIGLPGITLTSVVVARDAELPRG